jgi:hypothetical protein
MLGLAYLVPKLFTGPSSHVLERPPNAGLFLSWAVSNTGNGDGFVTLAAGLTGENPSAQSLLTRIPAGGESTAFVEWKINLPDGVYTCYCAVRDKDGVELALHSFALTVTTGAPPGGGPGEDPGGGGDPTSPPTDPPADPSGVVRMSTAPVLQITTSRVAVGWDCYNGFPTTSVTIGLFLLGPDGIPVAGQENAGVTIPPLTTGTAFLGWNVALPAGNHTLRVQALWGGLHLLGQFSFSLTIQGGGGEPPGEGQANIVPVLSAPTIG